MIAIVGILVLALVVFFIGAREFTDRGRTGVLGHILFLPLVVVAFMLMTPPAIRWLAGEFAATLPFVLVAAAFGLGLLFAPYLATHVANVFSGWLLPPGTPPAEPPNPFVGAEQAAAIGSIASALEEYRRLLAAGAKELTFEQMSTAQVRIAELLIRQDEWEEALKATDQALARKELYLAQVIQLVLVKSEALEKLGRRQEAVDVLERCLSQDVGGAVDASGRLKGALISQIAARLRALAPSRHGTDDYDGQQSAPASGVSDASSAADKTAGEAGAADRPQESQDQDSS